MNIINKDYRPDINGLRAVAVLLVLFFHLEYDFLRAGFLGVDVFLVISGYLISRNILKDLDLEKFSFKNFYTRRFKRLFPALFFTLSLTLIIGFIILSPTNLERLGKSTLSGIFSIANIFLFNENGYFDLESESKPLLHIWSLSLEEQFYFVWPLILLGLFKFFRKQIFLIVFFIILISLYINSKYLTINSEAVFYLLPFRFFEFLFGVMCVWLDNYKLKNKITLEIILLSGLGLIIYSSINFSMLTPMPGVLSLIPCIGTMMVIYAGNAKYSSWLLKNKLFEIIGKSSYSIYLVHWPLIVYYKYFTLSELTDYNKILFGIASIVLGYLMWKYIENIFRKSTLKYTSISNLKIDNAWLMIASAVVIISIASINIWINKGYPDRFPIESNMTTEQIKENTRRYWSESRDPAILNGTNDKNLIIMGNSFSIDLIYALRENGLKATITSLQTFAVCYNFGSPLEDEFNEKCLDRKKMNLENVNWSKADAIYLHDHWPKKDSNDLNNFLNEIRELSDAPIYVFGPKMVFKSTIPDIVHACRSSSPIEINNYAQDFAEVDDRSEMNNFLIDFFKEESYNNNNIYYVNILDVLGNGKNRFDIISNKTSEFLYFDDSHFTHQGAKEFGEKLKEVKPHLFNLNN